MWLAAPLLAAAFCSFGAHGERAAIQSTDSIRARAKQFLTARLDPLQQKDARIEIGRLDPRLRLRQCDAPLQAFAVGGRPRVGATSVGIRCDDRKPWTLYVTAQVVVFGDVVVAARAVNRGDQLRPADLRLQRKDLSKLAYGYLTQVQSATGKVLKRSYVNGAVVQPDQLQAPKLVKRGQQVTLHAEAGGIEVRMAGTALSDGAAGDRIQVRNSRSNRVVEGEVVAEGVVKIRI